MTEMSLQVPVRIQTGAPVRIDGKEFYAGPVISGGRVFYDKEAGTQIVVSEAQQLRLALHLRLLDNSKFEGLSSSRRQSLKTDLGTFTSVERKIALTRARFVHKLDKIEPALQRSKKKIIQKVIEEVCEVRGIDPNNAPSPRMVRTWYRTFVTAGRDIRALVPCFWARGRHGPRYQRWQLETINRIINDKLVTPTPSSFRQARLAANSALKREAAQRGEELKLLRKDQAGIGSKLISRMLRERNKFGVLVETTNLREAQRRARAIQLGPQGDCVNHEWEVDHTLLDILVIDEQTKQIAGRPWLTAIMDRYSRCIVGFSMAFAPPSWASIMDALRVAVMPKQWILDGLNAMGNGELGIENKWDCYGKPDRLIMDHGRDFKSLSMEATLEALQIDPDYTKPRKPWLKGKIERWFRTLEEQIVHTIPGTVMSKWENRKFYNSEKFAVLTIDELNWIVAKWVIDIYHQDQHGKIGRSPAQAWKEGLQEITPHRVIPDNLLVPLTGLIVPRALREGGIRFKGLRWDSEEFSKARAFLPDSANVQVRIDPLDITLCYLYDEKRSEWIEGQLVEPVEARGRTLNQWVTIARLRKRIAERGNINRDEALARAFEQVGRYVRDRMEERLKSKAPKRFAAFISTGSAWAKIRPETIDPDHSPPGEHPLDIDQNDAPPLQPRSRFKEPLRHWLENDDEDDKTEDDAFDEEFARQAAEEARDDVTVSRGTPRGENARGQPPAEQADGIGDMPKENRAAAPVEEWQEPGASDDDDDDDITPLGYGRD